MTVLPIRTLGDPVLRTPSAPVTEFDAALSTLIEDMIETMFDVGGVGLAAPQVGIGLRLFTYGIEGPDGEVGHMINPVLELGEEPQEGGEGCLSVPGLHSETPRRAWARVTGVDRNNRPLVLEGEGLLARCFQHEYDHLDGLLYIDRLTGEPKKEIMRQIRSDEYAARTQGVQRQRAGPLSTGFGGAANGAAAGASGGASTSRGSSFGAGSAFGAGASFGRSAGGNS